jgi:hypothetical protein
LFYDSYTTNENNKLGNVNEKLGTYYNEISKYKDVNRNPYSNDSEFFQSVYDYVIENDLMDKEIIAKAKYVSDYIKGIPLLKHIDWTRITSGELAAAIYRYNKSVPVKGIKKMNPNYYVNLNEKELSWLTEIEKLKYNNCRI